MLTIIAICAFCFICFLVSISFAYRQGKKQGYEEGYSVGICNGYGQGYSAASENLLYYPENSGIEISTESSDTTTN